MPRRSPSGTPARGPCQDGTPFHIEALDQNRAEMAKKAAQARLADDYDGLVDPADTIPEDAEGNNVQVEINAGDNVRDFHLKKPAK